MKRSGSRHCFLAIWLALGFSTTFAAPADPAWFLPLTMDRIAALPAAEQEPWRHYLERSQQLAAAHKAFLAAELAAAGLKETKLAPVAANLGVDLEQPAAWFATSAGQAVTAAIISYQTPAGGWSKRLDLGQGRRPPGGDFVSESRGSYVGTFDNGSTIAQLRALARAVTATGDEPAKAAFARGLTYVFDAQYPNGGWPQVYPLQGGYHDAITYNDNAIINLLGLLGDVAAGKPEFNFVPAEIRQKSVARIERARVAILGSQVKVDGKLTGWCQQHDMLTLLPCGARNFEMVALTTAESGELLRYLLGWPAPSPAVIAAIDGAAAWLEKTAIRGYAWKHTGAAGRQLIPTPGAGPLWARFLEIGTDRPLFGDRDRSIHYDVEEISPERRNGYAWYGNGPARQLQHYANWRVKLRAAP